MKPMFLPDVEQNPKPSPYADAIRMMQSQGQRYPQIWPMLAYLPKATGHLVAFTQEMLRESGPLTPGFRELIAAYTSSRNQCPFCWKSHAAFAAVLLGQERGLADGEALVAGALADIETSGLDDREKALMRFVDRVNRESPSIVAEDLDVVRAAGWTDEAIYYAITICALFNFFNRWIDASGVHALSDEENRQGAKRSAATGYVRK